MTDQQSNESSVSPRPWEIYRCSYVDETGEPHQSACGFNGETLDFSSDECHHPLSMADAELIVKAVNAYDENQATIKDLQERLGRLEKENRGLRSIVTACSKEPMPEWSKKIWDLNETIEKQGKVIKDLVEALQIVYDGYLADPGSDFDWVEWEVKAKEALNSIPKDLL